VRKISDWLNWAKHPKMTIFGSGPPRLVVLPEQTIPVRQSFKMRYIAGYLLAVLGGNENPSTADVSAILSAAGVEVDQELLNLVHSQVSGKSLDELIAAGNIFIVSSSVKFFGHHHWMRN
jgi:hypothetical protein